MRSTWLAQTLGRHESRQYRTSPVGHNVIVLAARIDERAR